MKRTIFEWALFILLFLITGIATYFAGQKANELQDLFFVIVFSLIFYAWAIIGLLLYCCIRDAIKKRNRDAKNN